MGQEALNIVEFGNKSREFIEDKTFLLDQIKKLRKRNSVKSYRRIKPFQG